MSASRPAGSYRWALRDGHVVARPELLVDADCLAMRYALSAFEGVRCYEPVEGGRARPLLLASHLDRLSRSLQLASLPSVDLEQLDRDVSRLIEVNDIRADAYLRIAATATGSGTMDAAPDLAVFVTATPMGRKRWLGEGQRMRLAVGPRKPEGTLLPHEAKLIAQYAGPRAALMASRAAGYDGVLLLDHCGHLAEAPTANLMVVMEGRLLTPALDCDVLPGITRRLLMRLGSELGLDVEESRLVPADLADVEEAFLCGTAIEIAPVGSIEGFEFPTAAPVTEALTERLFGFARG